MKHVTFLGMHLGFVSEGVECSLCSHEKVMLARILRRTVVDGVECVRVGIYGGMANTAVWFFRVGDTLIDCGCPNQEAAVRRFVTERQSVLKRVLITHHHEDHGGNGAMLQEEFGLDVLAPEGAIEPLRDGFPLEIYRRMVWGSPRRFIASKLPSRVVARLDEEDSNVPKVLLRGKSSAKEAVLESVPAPGHSGDHTVFHCASRGWLFGADLFVTSRPKMARFDEDPLQSIHALEELVTQRNISVLFCAHRGPVVDGAKVLEERLDYLQTLRKRLLQRISDEDLDWRDTNVLKRLALEECGGDGLLGWFSRGDFSGYHLVRGLVEGYDSFAATRRAIGRPHTLDATTFPLPKGVKVTLGAHRDAVGPHLEVEGVGVEDYVPKGLLRKSGELESPERAAIELAAKEAKEEEEIRLREEGRGIERGLDTGKTLVAGVGGRVVVGDVRPPPPLTSSASRYAALHLPDPTSSPGSGDPRRPFSNLDRTTRIQVSEFLPRQSNSSPPSSRSDPTLVLPSTESTPHGEGVEDHEVEEGVQGYLLVPKPPLPSSTSSSSSSSSSTSTSSSLSAAQSSGMMRKKKRRRSTFLRGAAQRLSPPATPPPPPAVLMHRLDQEAGNLDHHESIFVPPTLRSSQSPTQSSPQPSKSTKPWLLDGDETETDDVGEEGSGMVEGETKGKGRLEELETLWKKAVDEDDEEKQEVLLKKKREILLEEREERV